MPAKKNQDNVTVSIICRSTGRAELQQALNSVVQQHYPALELVLVDALAKGLEAPPDLLAQIDAVQIVSSGQAMSRPVAANAGLDAASGQLLMFLDEDDWIASDHIANLVACLRANPDVQAAYSSTRKTDAQGRELETVFREAYQPLLLMRDNYIPIHAMLFSAELIAKGCRFDETFDIYEDWDFWLQLNQHTAFIHVDQMTAFYREGGDSDTATGDTANRYRQGHPLCEARARLFDKWLPHWHGQQLNALIGDMDKSHELVELAGLLDREHQANLAHQEQIRQQLQDLEARQHQLNLRDQQISELEQNIRALQQEKENISNHLALVQSSLSWKVTKPLRAIRRLGKK
jgi:hypothetical protein